MIRDLYNTFDDGSTVDTADGISDVIDTGAVHSGGPFTSQQFNAGEPMSVVVTVTEVFNTFTSLAFTVESDSQADLAGTPVVHSQKRTLVRADGDLAAGKQYVIHTFPAGAPVGRYLGVRKDFDATGGANTTGKTVIVLMPASAVPSSAIN